jgi:hypothetical protein
MSKIIGLSLIFLDSILKVKSGRMATKAMSVLEKPVRHPSRAVTGTFEVLRKSAKSLLYVERLDGNTSKCGGKTQRFHDGVWSHQACT